MSKGFRSEFNGLLIASAMGMVFTLFLLFLPGIFRSYAGNSGNVKGLITKTESYSADLANYDIRLDKSSFDKITGFRQSLNKNASQIADIRDGFVAGESALSAKVPTLKVEYNTDIRIPEVIAPDVAQGRSFLTEPSSLKRSEILRTFAKENSALLGFSPTQSDLLKVTADYTNPDGNLSFASLEQTIGGIPVFRGVIKAGFTKKGEMVRVINNLAPGLDYGLLSTEFGDPLAAVTAAAGFIKIDSNKLNLNKNAATSTDIKTVFGEGDWATTAEKMYFPTEPGVAVPAWRVLIWQPVNAFYVIVDAATGTMLWRKNITEDQTQSATYNVWTNPNAMINVADSPFPLTPGPTSPNGQQGTALGTNLIQRIGNEPPYTFNNNGWITDGGTETDGNAVEAGLDRDATNGVDTVNGRASSPTRTFSFPFSPSNPNTGTGDSPVPPGEPVSPCSSIPQPHGFVDAQKGAVTQLFYINNWYHDELYRLGFTEAAANFQQNNFGRGGLGADRVSAEAQDCSGTNNANFSTPADGGRGRMQMYIWTGPATDIDGDVDADIVIHEHTHGLSNRLHGNGSGLSSNMSRGMGEGWGDFYGHSLLSEPSDPINGIYTTGGYATFNIASGFTANYYYGIRRYPKAVIGFTGGANNKPHNAFTFKYVNADCNNFLNSSFFAYGRGPVGVTTCDQVHNIGEVWSSALWEARAKFVTRLGWAVGNRRMLQFVTDGMKLAPIGPTMLQERDAIIAAAQASSLAPGAAADVADLWAGFALRGMGFSASIQNAGSGASDTAVTEGFDLPNLLQTPIFTVSDASGNNNGFPDPGENLTLTIPLTNNTGNTAVGTTLQVVGGGSTNYGNVASGTTVSQNVSFTVPPGTQCGSVLQLTFNVNSSLGPTSFTRSISIGRPNVTFTQNFDGVTAPSLPAGWTAVPVSGGTNFVNTTNTPDTAPNTMYALDPTTVGGGSDLTSPSIPISAAAALVSFRHKYDTEAGWDGGLLEISIAGGAFQDIITAGGAFIQNGYTGALGVNTAGNSPLGGRPAWSGNSGGYITSIVRLPAAAAGQNVQLRWRFGADDNTSGTGPNPGWYVDTIQVSGSYSCTGVSRRSPFDFDGDGKTDVSVFRPSLGQWWVYRSSDGGNLGVQFGASTDVISPGDFTGDGKTDMAFFRPSTGQWFILRSEDFSFYGFQFGTNGDIPTPADFDGDGKTDVAVFRPSSAAWYVFRSSDSGVTALNFGLSTDKPAAADYDGDGKADVAVWRPNGATGGEWWILKSSTGSVYGASFGTSTDKTVQGDYTGDGKADIAFFRPSTGFWYVLRSEDFSFYGFPFGTNGDTPAPGDYDGDGKTDAAVFRQPGAQWFVNSSSGTPFSLSFGAPNDAPVPNAFVR